MERVSRKTGVAELLYALHYVSGILLHEGYLYVYAYVYAHEPVCCRIDLRSLACEGLLCGDIPYLPSGVRVLDDICWPYEEEMLEIKRELLQTDNLWDLLYIDAKAKNTASWAAGGKMASRAASTTISAKRKQKSCTSGIRKKTRCGKSARSHKTGPRIHRRTRGPALYFILLI